MEEAKGEMKVMEARRKSISHFFFGAKFKGFSGSSWPSHPTIPLSRSFSGSFGRSSCPFFLLLELNREAMRDILLRALLLDVVRDIWGRGVPTLIEDVDVAVCQLIS